MYAIRSYYVVEEAVYKEFESISERGGVLGAMDTMYQRSKIQDESMYYEHRKHDGSLPIIGRITSYNVCYTKLLRSCIHPIPTAIINIILLQNWNHPIGKIRTCSGHKIRKPVIYHPIGNNDI